MLGSFPLPDTLLVELGKMVIIWANIEQDLTLQSSAMAAQKTDGYPIDHLRLDFKRLRRTWLELCREGFDDEIVTKVVEPLNDGLARFALERGSMVHGLWSHLGSDRFELMYWEQRKNSGLSSYKGEYTLTALRETTTAHRSLGLEVHHFCTGKHPCFKNKKGIAAKIHTNRPGNSPPP